MVFKPILFNTEMIQAILEGRKTQTRRIIRLTPGFTGHPVGESGNPNYKLGFMYPCGIKRPPCDKGDILWVRETWSTTEKCGLYPPWTISKTHYMYKADNPDFDAAKEARWFPSIHMPKAAARIFLKVNDVRAERLWAMDEEEAIAEGFKDSPAGTDSPLQRFFDMWDKKFKGEDRLFRGWHANPWVWVIEFERCEMPENFLEET